MTQPRGGPTRDSDPAAGRLIGRRYRLVERVGGGTTANVYRAIDERLDRPVAVKLLRDNLVHDRRFVRRFVAEARHVASLTHPNVVPVYDVGTDGGPYLVTEFIEGQDLASVLTVGGRQEPRDAARIAMDVAAGLQAAHDRGVVHRNVKPGNILVGTDGRARVADFGIARASVQNGMAATGTLPGSVEYYSPEQARGQQAEPASDIYALGVILYELLTGVRPFAGATLNALATARLRVPAPDPRGAAPSVPDGLASIVGKAMATDPANRYRSARAMRGDLVAWLDQQRSTGAKPVPLPWQSPRRAWPLAIALLALAVAGYLGGRAMTSNTTGDPRVPAHGLVVPSILPGGAAFTEATPTPTAVPTARPTAAPTEAPVPTPTPTLRPTPTAAPAGPITAPGPPAPTAAAASAVKDPADSVASFYANAAAGQFDAAYGLWSARMKAAYPRQANLDDRFDETADITFSSLYVARQTAGSATVQANFTETYDGGSSRRFVGYWNLVWVGGRWLLDAPTY